DGQRAHGTGRHTHRRAIGEQAVPNRNRRGWLLGEVVITGELGTKPEPPSGNGEALGRVPLGAQVPRYRHQYRPYDNGHEDVPEHAVVVLRRRRAAGQRRESGCRQTGGGDGKETEHEQVTPGPPWTAQAAVAGVGRHRRPVLLPPLRRLILGPGCERLARHNPTARQAADVVVDLRLLRRESRRAPV